MAAARPKRKPAQATSRHLENVALFYLQRYASSTENLRRVLMRRVVRAAEAHGSDVEEGEAQVDALLGRLEAAGLLDDRRYADAAARGLARRGRSRRGIGATLLRKGVPADLARATVDRLEAEDPEVEIKAAVAYARRRRLGPYRPQEDRAERRVRDLAAMARAGFSTSVARAVVDSVEVEDLYGDPSVAL